MVDDSVEPHTLKDRSVESLARFMKSGVVKKIVVLVRGLFREAQSHTLMRDRLVPASVHPRAFQTFAPQIRACMPT